MRAQASSMAVYTAQAATTSLVSLELEEGEVTPGEMEPTACAHLRQLAWRFLYLMPLAMRKQAIPHLIPRILAISSLTGFGQLSVVLEDTVAHIAITGAVAGEVLLIQMPHSVGLALFPRIIDPSPNEVFVYRKATLGDETTGLYHVTVAARGEDQAAVDAISITKNAEFSTPGTVGTFALNIDGAVGLFLHSVTVTTYTRVETQAKLVVVIDNPQGPAKAHEAVRPSATLITGNGSQLSTPTVVLTGATGAIPATNGIPHQLDPEAEYGHIRVSAVGFAQATDNVVTDPAYNKAQSLVIQF